MCRLRYRPGLNPSTRTVAPHITKLEKIVQLGMENKMVEKKYPKGLFINYVPQAGGRGLGKALSGDRRVSEIHPEL